MTGFLLDTNVVSEIMRGERSHAQVRTWFQSLDPAEIYFSTLTLGELRYGIAKLAKKDRLSAIRLERWLERILSTYASRFLPIEEQVAQLWGEFRSSSRQTPPPIDALIAATAAFHDLILATRNVSDFKSFPIKIFNPWKS